MRFLLPTLLLCSAFLSCNKDDKRDAQGAQTCFTQSGAGDSATIAKKLPGTWRWIREACYWTGSDDEASHELFATFNADRSYSIIEKGRPALEGTWHFEHEGTGWGIALAQMNGQMTGTVEICDQYLSFNLAYRDACDNLFVRVK